MFKNIKWWLQKKFRGYSDCDLWNLDMHLAELIHDRLVRYKKMIRHGYPSDTTVDEWEIILDKMIYAFRIHSDISLDTILLPKKDRDIVDKKTVEGVELFTKYYFDLWD